MHVYLFYHYCQVFRIMGTFVELNPAFRDYQERTARVAEVLQNLRKENEICALKGWRDEVTIVYIFIVYLTRPKLTFVTFILFCNF